MIRMTRAPFAQLKRFNGESRNSLELELLRMRRAALPGSIASDAFNSTVWKAAKNSLKRESHNKCGWCESITAPVAHGDVEHIRPKSRHWWLAYAYHNYLYSCQICNQSFKGDKYPTTLAATSEPAVRADMTDDELQALIGTLSPDAHASIETVAAWYAAIQAEQPHLIDPHIDDPESFFAWHVDHALLEIHIAPRPGIAPDDATRAQTTIDTLGLNREELRQTRHRALRNVLTMYAIRHALPPDTSLLARVDTDISDARSNQGIYAGAARFLMP